MLQRNKWIKRVFDWQCAQLAKWVVQHLSIYSNWNMQEYTRTKIWQILTKILKNIHFGKSLRKSWPLLTLRAPFYTKLWRGLHQVAWPWRWSCSWGPRERLRRAPESRKDFESTKTLPSHNFRSKESPENNKHILLIRLCNTCGALYVPTIVYFWSLQTLKKLTVGVCGIRTRIIGEEGEHADQLIPTTAP